MPENKVHLFLSSAFMSITALSRQCLLLHIFEPLLRRCFPVISSKKYHHGKEKKMQSKESHRRDDDRVIIHFDYDAFYASVVENEDPALKNVPLAIQQKQIVVTCNYEARRRGLYKLQLITEAKKACPEAVIILGEDLTRFRNASKDLHNFLREQIWSDKVERLGFDEVWLDCTDMIQYNYELLNKHDLKHSFFYMDRHDPTKGFEFDGSTIFGPTYPAQASPEEDLNENDRLVHKRLLLGSHLARHMRHELEAHKGYTATVGIATNKTLSKLVGNVNKPRNQTTLVPPLSDHGDMLGSIHTFMDFHDIGRIPGIGFKLAQKIRACVLGREAAHEEGLVYGGTKEQVTVRDVRLNTAIDAKKLEGILGGPGSQKGIGGRIWQLINGYDDAEVSRVKRVPSQISQEDSYMKYLHTFDQVRQQLFLLAERLIRRMHIDLMEDDLDDQSSTRRWLARPRTLRLTTRPRPPVDADGTRKRTFNRISHSGPLPNFVFNLTEGPSVLADRLVDTALVPMFRRLHPERHGWNLSLINIAVTNMTETAADDKDSEGRDIGRMLRRQEDTLKDFKVIQPDTISDEAKPETMTSTTSNGSSCSVPDENLSDIEWDVPSGLLEPGQAQCRICNQRLPDFAMAAHTRYHELLFQDAGL